MCRGWSTQRSILSLWRGWWHLGATCLGEETEDQTPGGRASDLTCHSVQLGGLRWIGSRALRECRVFLFLNTNVRNNRAPDLRSATDAT